MVVLLALIIGGLAGLLIGERRAPFGTPMPVHSMPKLDYFIESHSFSEIQQTKAKLEALSRRYCAEVQARRVLDMSNSSDSSRLSTTEPHLDGAIKVLETGLKEFEGTGQQLGINAELLLALRSAKRFDKWIDRYLQTLYEHPTCPTIGLFAKDALRFGRAVGRESEVVRAFRHVCEIPLNFEYKSELEAVLVQLPKNPNPVGGDNDQKQQDH